jgi:hypothetical protein
VLPLTSEAGLATNFARGRHSTGYRAFLPAGLLSNRPTLIPTDLSRGLFEFFPAIFAGPRWILPAFKPAVSRFGAFGTGKTMISTG